MSTAEPSRRFARRRIVVGALVSILGLALLIWQVRQAHPDKITEALAQIKKGSVDAHFTD